MIHLLLLGLVVLVVIAASRDVYQKARDQALDQARIHQKLLVTQSARGIESYYHSILNDLDLLKMSEDDAVIRGGANLPATASFRAFRLGPVLWAQLRGRISHLLAVDRQRRTIVQSFANEGQISSEEVVKETGEWLSTVTEKTISPLVRIGALRANLLVEPVGPEGRLLLVAVVPVDAIKARFLNEINNPQATLSAMLTDENGMILAHPQSRLEGINLANGAANAQLRAVALQYLASGKAGSEIFEQANMVGGVEFKPAIVSVQPIELVGKKWWLVISSGIADVDTVVIRMFHGALVWAGFVIVSVTAILVSTSMQMIRGRSRLERIQHEILQKELSQAREIQLAWLPAQNQIFKTIDIAAINHPASHISGDFYNWFELDDGRLVVTIGDVTGHGMAAAFLMATTQLFVRTTMLRVKDPGLCLEEVNRSLCSQIFNGQFVTMLIVILDVDNGTMEVATAGHSPPLVADGGEFKPLGMSPQLVLGIENDAHFETEKFALPAAASVLLYTDGVTDVVAANGERFSAESLQRGLSGRFDSAQAIIGTVVTAVTEFRGARELPDDLTMVAIQLQPVTATPQPEPLSA
ncbi:MAG TPA: SpoIIE family protein phosphatase [Tepidisphaeraceae bacterium]